MKKSKKIFLFVGAKFFSEILKGFPFVRLSKHPMWLAFPFENRLTQQVHRLGQKIEQGLYRNRYIGILMLGLWASCYGGTNYLRNFLKFQLFLPVCSCSIHVRHAGLCQIKWPRKNPGAKCCGYFIAYSVSSFFRVAIAHSNNKVSGILLWLCGYVFQLVHVFPRIQGVACPAAFGNGFAGQTALTVYPARILIHLPGTEC